MGNVGLIAPIAMRSVLSDALVLGLALLMARAYVAPFSVQTDVALTQGALPAIPGAPEVALTAMDIHFSLTEIRLPSN